MKRQLVKNKSDAINIQWIKERPIIFTFFYHYVEVQNGTDLQSQIDSFLKNKTIDKSENPTSIKSHKVTTTAKRQNNPRT